MCPLRGNQVSARAWFGRGGLRKSQHPNHVALKLKSRVVEAPKEESERSWPSGVSGQEQVIGSREPPQGQTVT